MSSDGRFYQLEFRDRPVLHGDIGSMLRIEGLVVSGGGAHAILMLPESPEPFQAPILRLSAEEWSDYLRRSDDPEILVGPAKAFHRKARYEISGLVQQRVWVADGMKCLYCLRPMGQVQLTIDHFIPLEIGGTNEPSNYLSACRRCNKDKGCEAPEKFCARRKISYALLVEYLATRKLAA
jgi:hypothetical protein